MQLKKPSKILISKTGEATVNLVGSEITWKNVSLKKTVKKNYQQSNIKDKKLTSGQQKVFVVKEKWAAILHLEKNKKSLKNLK